MIEMTEYAKRRKSLMQKMTAEEIAIIPGSHEILRSNDCTYPFRQNSDFYYLTGFNEPESILVLSPKRNEGEYILFNRIRDPSHEIWDGPRAGQEGARKNFLADQSFPSQDFIALLPDLLAGKEVIQYPIGRNKTFDKILFDGLNQLRTKIRGGIQFPTVLRDITATIHEMRLFKSESEIALLQKAVDISEKAHLKAMRACKPGRYEYELEAELMYEFFIHGGRSPAYNPIVGAGSRTCILHYGTNDQKIENGDLVLIDAGVEYENYAADITRTFPANGKFSAPQRAIYELVLAAQTAAIQSIKPGVPWDQAQTIIVELMTQGLIDLGILKGKLSGLIEKQAYLPFYMHRSGHWLGLDVHDVGRYRLEKKWRPLEPGMVLTVEPGIYISSDIPGVDKRWHNIGIRIEDDVLVTKTGYHVFSEKLPKKINDIEAIMAK